MNLDKDERILRFLTTQIGRYVIAAIVIIAILLIIAFPPVKGSEAVYIAFGSPLIMLVLTFFFKKASSNDSVPTDTGTTTTSGGSNGTLPFDDGSEYAYAPNPVVPPDARITPAGDLHAGVCGCGDCKPYVEPKWWTEPPTPVVPPVPVSATSAFDFDAILNGLQKEAVVGDNLLWTPMLAMLRFRNWLINLVDWSEFKDGEAQHKAAYAYAIKLAEAAYVDTIGAEPPHQYAPMALYNKFIASLKADTKNKYGCGKVPAEPVRVAVMNLRELYRDYEELLKI